MAYPILPLKCVILAAIIIIAVDANSAILSNASITLVVDSVPHRNYILRCFPLNLPGVVSSSVSQHKRDFSVRPSPEYMLAKRQKEGGKSLPKKHLRRYRNQQAIAGADGKDEKEGTKRGLMHLR